MNKHFILSNKCHKESLGFDFIFSSEDIDKTYFRKSLSDNEREIHCSETFLFNLCNSIFPGSHYKADKIVPHQPLATNGFYGTYYGHKVFLHPEWSDADICIIMNNSIGEN